MYGVNTIRKRNNEEFASETNREYLFVVNVSEFRTGLIASGTFGIGCHNLEEHAMVFSDTGAKILKHISKDPEKEIVPSKTVMKAIDMLVPTCVSYSGTIGYLHIDIVDDKMAVNIVSDKKDASLLFRDEWKSFIKCLVVSELKRKTFICEDFIVSTDIVNQKFVLTKDKKYVQENYKGYEYVELFKKEDIKYCTGDEMHHFTSFEEARNFKQLDEDLEIRAL